MVLPRVMSRWPALRGLLPDTSYLVTSSEVCLAFLDGDHRVAAILLYGAKPDLVAR